MVPRFLVDHVGGREPAARRAPRRLAQTTGPVTAAGFATRPTWPRGSSPLGPPHRPCRRHSYEPPPPRPSVSSGHLRWSQLMCAPFVDFPTITSERSGTAIAMTAFRGGTGFGEFAPTGSDPTRSTRSRRSGCCRRLARCNWRRYRWAANPENTGENWCTDGRYGAGPQDHG